MAKVITHTLDGANLNHLPGSGLCDYATLCGSLSGQDDGEFSELHEGEVECPACKEQLHMALVCLTSTEIKCAIEAAKPFNWYSKKGK